MFFTILACFLCDYPHNISSLKKPQKSTSFMSSRMGLSSSRLCLEQMENTRMNAWPLEMDNRCMAGN